MRPERSAQRILSITRAKAKMYEHAVPLEDHITWTNECVTNSRCLRPVEGLSFRSRSRPLATYLTLYVCARNCLSLVSNVAKEIKFSCPSGLMMILFV